MSMETNKLDAVFAKLADNETLYQRLIDAVKWEAQSAQEKFHFSAAQALYHPDVAPQACGQGGISQTWNDILNRLYKYQHK